MPRTDGIQLTIEAARQAEVEHMLHLGGTWAESIYPPGANFLLDIKSLEHPGVSVYLARDDAGLAMGMCAVVPLGIATNGGEPAAREAELKRMFVHDAARGRGVASALLGRIEADAVASGVRRLLLETGTKHDAALALYSRAGYAEIDQFGEYRGEEFSICMAKRL